MYIYNIIYICLYDCICIHIYIFTYILPIYKLLPPAAPWAKYSARQSWSSSFSLRDRGDLSGSLTLMRLWEAKPG